MTAVPTPPPSGAPTGGAGGFNPARGGFGLAAELARVRHDLDDHRRLLAFLIAEQGGAVDIDKRAMMDAPVNPVLYVEDRFTSLHITVES